MALSKSPRYYKNTPPAKKFSSKFLFYWSIFLIAVSFASSYFFFQKNLSTKNPEVNGNFLLIASEIENLLPEKIKLNRLGYLPGEPKSQILEIITSEKWKIIIDLNKNLKEQIGLVDLALDNIPEYDRKNLSYIGVDAQG